MDFKCVFTFLNAVNNNGDVYTTGQILSGVVKCDIPKEKIFNKITINVKGKAKLHIRDKMSRRRSGGGNSYGYEFYEDLEEIVQLSSKQFCGSYLFPFNFIIPEDIPPSFGYIKKRGRYMIKCRIKHRIYAKFYYTNFLGETKKKKFKKEIFIIAAIKPRITPVPLIYGNFKDLSLTNSKKNTINIKAYIESSIRIPGESVKFSYELTNDSYINILCVKVKLLETYVFKINRSKIKVFNNLSDPIYKSKKIMKRSTYKESFEIALPNNASSVDFSKIVRRDYSVHICVVLPCLHKNMIIQMPVLVNAKADASIANLTNSYFVKDFVKQISLYDKK